MSTGSRIAMLDIDEAKRRAATRGIPDTMAELSVFRIALHQPGVAAGLSNMLHELLWKGVLDARLRELIIMRIGWSTGSVYEWTQHWRVARLLDVPERDLLAVRDWRTAEHFGVQDIIDPRESRPLLCDWVRDAYRLLPQQIGRPSFGTRP